METADSQQGKTCQYQGCGEACLKGHDLCFWHDPDSDKTGPDIAPRLEIMARAGKSLEGFHLARANLQNINLARRKDGSGPNLSHVDFYRANLRGAHLFRANLERTNLLKADLSGANLNFSNLSGANLLGVKLDNCRMEHVIWGRTLYQEIAIKQKRITRTHEQKQELYGEAEEVCRGVRQSCESHGLVEEAGYFFHKEMTLRRYQYPVTSWQRWVSKMVDLLCGYGERPLRVFAFSSCLIVICALFYLLSGFQQGGQLIRWEFNVPFSTNLASFWDALYFSVVTFTTLGYGDLTPIGPSRTLAALEAFVGNFALALFVVVFVKKMTR